MTRRRKLAVDPKSGANCDSMSNSTHSDQLEFSGKQIHVKVFERGRESEKMNSDNGQLILRTCARILRNIGDSVASSQIAERR